jgi:glycosyltransferase involved in cell wall biosynthesis
LKFILVNWYFAHEGVLGGCESFHDKLARALRGAGHDVEFVSYKIAATEAGINIPYNRLQYPEVEAAILIDRYLETHYSKSDSLIVRDAGVGGFSDLRLREVDVFGNPYYTLYDRLLEAGKIDRLTYHHYHDFNTFLEKRTAEHSLQNVALSSFMAEVEMRSLGIRFDKVINNAVDVELFKPLDKKLLRKKWNVPLDCTVACWVGSWTAVKGIEIMMQLSSRFRDIEWILVLKNSFPDYSLLPIWSAGEYSPISLPSCLPITLARKLRDASVMLFAFRKGNVKILSQLRPEQLSEIYGLSDFAVLPYVCEGNSHAVLEACSSNLPLVITPVGLFWDFWDERVGYRVTDPFDMAEYVETVRKMLVEPSVFQPRKMIIEKELDLGTWGKRWVDYLVSLDRNKS